MTLKILPTDTEAEVGIRTHFRALCPEDGEPDDYKLTVDYEPDGWVVEYHSFRDYLDDYRGKEVADHDLCDEIYDDVEAAIEPKSLAVKLGAHHGGVFAEVRRS